MRLRFIVVCQVVIAAILVGGCASRRSPHAANLTQEERLDGCVFCEIASGKLQKERVVYRDDNVIAFMDRAPRNEGHVLVIPASHATDIMNVPPTTLGHMAEVAQRIAKAIKATDLPAEGFNLISNTGAAAGQSVFHLHLHVIPRFPGEPPYRGEHQGIRPSDELNRVASKIRDQLKRVPH
jgi:histidine triad (HIT) family protein